MLTRPTTLPFPKSPLILWAVLALMLAACSLLGAPEGVSPQATSTTAPVIPAPTEAGAATAPDPLTPTEPAPAASGNQLRLVLAPDGNEARYRVREQLASLSFPSDAVGVTRDISGSIVIQTDGTVVRDGSMFVVDLRTLKSDQNRRDNFIQRNTLETSRFPTAEFVPAETLGLPSPLPASGEVTFQLVGDLTVHGVTRPATWDVKAQVVAGQELVGNASTSFNFADFGMTAPRVPVVLSIQEPIQLEFDFHLVLDSSGSP